MKAGLKAIDAIENRERCLKHASDAMRARYRQRRRENIDAARGSGSISPPPVVGQSGPAADVYAQFSGVVPMDVLVEIERAVQAEEMEAQWEQLRKYEEEELATYFSALAPSSAITD